jgi:hypothetical protein
VSNFELNSQDLSDFFGTVSAAKKKRKEELEESVQDSIDDFFGLISLEKKKIQEQKDVLVGNSFETLFLSKLTEEKVPKKKKKIIKKEEIITEDNSTKENIFDNIPEKNSSNSIESFIVEGLLKEPPSIKNRDPLTPLNDSNLGLQKLEKKFNLFVNRVQEQLSTLGGGGETNLTYMDVPITSVTTSSYTIKPQDYYVGVNYAGAVTITLPKADREGKVFVVKDELGEASKGTNRYITILPTGLDLIDGRDRAILAYDYGSLTFIWKGNSWRVV